jgi:hypothetical protein
MVGHAVVASQGMPPSGDLFGEAVALPPRRFDGR